MIESSANPAPADTHCTAPPPVPRPAALVRPSNLNAPLPADHTAQQPLNPARQAGRPQQAAHYSHRSQAQQANHHSHHKIHRNQSRISSSRMLNHLRQLGGPRALPLLLLLLLAALPPTCWAASPAEELQPAPTNPTTARVAASEQEMGQLRLSERDDPVLMSRQFDYHASMPVITKRELSAALKQASLSVASLRNLFEPQLEPMETGSLGWLANSVLHRFVGAHESFSNQTVQALVSEEATRLLAKRHSLDRLQVLRGLPLISVDQSSLGEQCVRPARTFSCAPGRYRSISGHCNNVQSPDWGSARMPLARYAPPRYVDHIARPVGASAAGRARTGSELLPSARSVSVSLHRALAGIPGIQHPHMTTMLSFFGQFVFHDLAQVGQYGASERLPLSCCGRRADAPDAEPAPNQLHPECMPVRDGTFCLDYVRSMPAVRAGCNLGARDQLNLVTSYLDGSAVYGSSEEQLRSLRAFSGGRLRSERPPGAGQHQLELLPRSPPAEPSPSASSAAASPPPAGLEECYTVSRMRASERGQQQQRRRPSETCFLAGDSRVNENIGLTLMHTIWLREHNYLASQLAGLNRHWTDEQLFQEARRILIGQLQHITYTEFLPSLLGQDAMERLNLSSLSQGYSYGYEPQLNAALSNELATAVLPFVQATLPASLERYSDRLEVLGATSLADTFMDSSELLKRNRFSQYLMGMLSQNALEPATGIMSISSMSTTLAEAGSAGSGGGGGAAGRARRSPEPAATGNGTSPPDADVLALTIQQGRDHGLKPYLYWRDACQLRPQVRTWQDLGQVMPADTVVALRSVYAHVDQIDLYLGLLESPHAGASLGPTFGCLLGRQFYQLKFADRYWYENDLPGSAFTPAQLDELRQTSLAKLLCRNGQSANLLSFVQPTPMLASDPYLNAYQYCTNRAMRQLDLSAWLEPVQSPSSSASAWSSWPAFGADADKRQVVSVALRRARRQLDQLVGEENARRSARLAQPANNSNKWSHPGYRYLPRPKRATLQLNNQSLLLELATNELVRDLLHQGKDREQANSIQADLRDFLNSLESIQLDNLLDNAQGHARLASFISEAGSSFINADQRQHLLQAADPVLADGATVAGPTRSSSISANCQDDDRAFPCDHTSPYRTITGWCNNLSKPKWGQSFTAHHRLLANAYEDGLSEPRQLSVVLADQDSGQRLPLPSARLISTAIHDDKSRVHARYTLALMQFGQFGVDHDLTRTPFSVASDGSLLDCSPCDSAKTVHRECLPIQVPAEDPHFRPAGDSSTGRRCLHFVRSLNGQTGLGPRQQLNALTSYLDGSNVYGSDNCEAKSLRSFQGGRLNSSSYPLLPQQQAATGARNGASQPPPPKSLLPTTLANLECVTPGQVCFHAGDQRASEQPGLTAIHTVFMRLHNSLVDQLSAINKHWPDEKLYQEGRRLVGAVLQRITYNEFLPRLLGLDYASKFDLLPRQVGYAPGAYDPTCSANILNEFSAAAFRMGHSLIRSSFPLLTKSYKPAGKALQLRKAFFNSERILSEPNLIDSILRGIVSTPIESLDNSVTEELTNHLFEKPREPHSGMDLISLNIQRARDHGIGPYNSYRAKCNLTRARSFDELAPEVPGKLIKRLAAVYASVDDIDLFTGGMSELPVHGGLVGPTLGCIIGLQMARLKKCDRFWHETDDPWVRFSAQQLAEIRKLSLAKVICQESDSIELIQRQAMDVPDSFLNPRVACASLPGLDFSHWRENLKSCQVNKIRIELGQSKRVNPCKSCTCTREGVSCRTAKINCLEAVRRTGAKLTSIMSDKSCLVQCAWVLDMQPLALQTGSPIS